MKGRDWERLARSEVLPALGDGYAVRRSLVYRRPIEHILLGVNAETKYEAGRLSFEATVMPLYRPNSGLVYFAEKWLGAVDVEDGELPQGAVEFFLDAVPFLDTHSTPELLLADQTWKRSDDLVRLEVEGYSYLLAGHAGTARQVLEHATDLGTDQEIEWEGETQDRCRLVLSLMKESPDRAQAQLVAWEEQTLAALRLSRE